MVNESDVMENIDVPEAGLDALMQVCPELADFLRTFPTKFVPEKKTHFAFDFLTILLVIP